MDIAPIDSRFRDKVERETETDKYAGSLLIVTVEGHTDRHAHRQTYRDVKK